MNLKDKFHELVQQSGFVLTEQDWDKLVIQDFNLGNFEKEGVAYIDLLNTQRLRITLLILLPNQVLPQHKHPPYGSEIGKEETVRTLFGKTYIYVKEEEKNKEICLNQGEQYTIMPDNFHEFQAGPAGSVNLAFQNRVDEAKNIFANPKSANCIVKGNR